MSEECKHDFVQWAEAHVKVCARCDEWVAVRDGTEDCAPRSISRDPDYTQE